jgi:3D (Asp-Asp-Asp) domain-containing protein
MRVLIAAIAAALLGLAAPTPPIIDHAVVEPPPPSERAPADLHTLFAELDRAPKSVAVAPARVWWRLRALTTGYSPHDAGDGAYHATKGERWRWITADLTTDVRDTPYGVAVDPRAIPYGTGVIVPGYHRGKTVDADDTGGCLRQSWARGVLHLDLRYQTAASAAAWGSKTMTVLVDVTDLPSDHRSRLERFRVR